MTQALRRIGYARPRATSDTPQGNMTLRASLDEEPRVNDRSSATATKEASWRRFIGGTYRGERLLFFDSLTLCFGAFYDLPRVRATRINHVSILANDLDESARFYEELFGLERLPTPRFEEPVLWLGIGDQQLHLFERPVEAPRYHHLAFDVDDFEALYLRAKEMGLLDDTTFGAQLRQHPAGWVQLYMRDPAGNLLEIDWPDAATLDRSVVAGIHRLDDEREQPGEAAVATLYPTRNTGETPA